MKTSLSPDSLSSAYFDDTFTMKYATSACDMWLILWFRLRHPLGQERLFVHGKTLVHGCHVCFFNLAGIPVILSKSNISPICKTHMFEDSTLAEVIAADCPTVFCSCCYRRFTANTLEMNKWSSVSRNDKIQKLREAKGPTLSQNWYHAHQFTLMINWTLFQYQTRHDDLIGLWWSFEAGKVFESKLSVSARNGEQSFWIWSPHNRERLGHEVKIHPHRYRCKMEAQGQLQLGGNPLFMRIEPMVGDEVTWYLTAVLDLFGFLPFFEFLYTPWEEQNRINLWSPCGRPSLRSDVLNVYMTFPTWSTIIKNTFHEFKIDNDITIASWATILATILDRQSLVSSTTQDVEIHLLKMKMHQRTRLTTLKDRKRQTVFALSWWQLTKWIAFSPLPKCQQVSTKRRKWKKNKSPPLKFPRPSGKVASRLVGLPLGYCR